VDILNLLNDTAEEGVVTGDFFSSNFDVGNRFDEHRLHGAAS